MRGQRFRFPGAEVEVEDVAHAGRVELRCVRRRQVEQVAVADARLDEGGVEALGHLQTNKARLAAGRFQLIQSVDSLRLAEHIARIEPAQPVLVEVNVAREPQKSGVAPEETVSLAIEIAKQLDLRGLMAMGPSHGDPTPAFEELRRLRDDAQQKIGRALPVLSMGMSGDFEAALGAGSTMLRLGQALFGPRPE